jgi:hypothetical protein
MRRFMSRPIASVLGAAAALAAVALMAGSANATIPQGNLIQNPGGEADQGVTDETSHACPTAWLCANNATVVRYGTTVFPSLAESIRIAGGNNFFAGGPNVPVAAMIQDGIDLSAAAAEIDAGGVQATLSACLGGFQDQDDNAQISMSTFPVGGGASATGPLAADRGNQTKLLPASSTRQLVPGIRTADVQLDFAGGGGGTYNDGYADNASLTLGPFPGPPPPAAPCAAPAVSPSPTVKKKCKKRHKRRRHAAEAKKHKRCKKRKHHRR